MNIFAKKLGITMLTVATAFGLMAPTMAHAESGSWQHERRYGGYHDNRKLYRHNYRADKHYYHNQRVYRHGRYRGHDDALTLGIIGLGVGAVIGGAIANSHNSPRVIYRHPPAGTRVISGGGSYEPWSQSWYRYCANKYRSFNASTGTYRGYDGRDHFCVVR